MNKYKKYCPNVFIAQCEDKHGKGETIIITTKYGKEIENEIHNYLGTRDDFHLYSVTRVDGFNSQERAKNKASKLEGYAGNAEKRSTEYYEASKEGSDFLSLGEPIKIGHHSERRHRKLIERNWARMGKSVAESEKAEEYKRRAEYWADKSNKIDLSMPDSLEYFEFELQKAKEKHQFLKDNPDKRSHSMSLQYANKSVKDLTGKVQTAIKLWGTEEEVQLLDEEKRIEAQNKAFKSKKKEDIISKYGGFFAFNTEQFKEGYEKIKEAGLIEEGEKVAHIKVGLYVPSKNAKKLISEL